MRARTRFLVSIFLSLSLSLTARPPLTAQDALPQLRVIQLQHDGSPPLRDIGPIVVEEAPHLMPFHPNPHQKSTGAAADPVIQSSVGLFVGTISGQNFAGLGQGPHAPTVTSAPPDANGAAGATQFVQWVNKSIAVFDKTSGALLFGPVAGNAPWKGFGGPCETSNSGDPIAQYDKAANRWVLAQPVFSPPFMYCIAVSTNSNATGSYHRYALAMNNFPDYPKLGIWSDGYYVSFNMFQGNKFVGPQACALQRSAMLAGAAAKAVCFQLSSTSSFGGLLPSDVDGTTAPPGGEPDFYLNFGVNSLNLWRFHVNFGTPSLSTFTGPVTIPVAAFTEACFGSICIPQAGTTERLDSLGDRLMYRLAYRNFTTHESLVVNHSVGTPSGIRWYEVRNPNGTPVVFQQGTFRPDSNYRWMGSMAMDKVGNIAIGYSVSSSSMHPSIRFTGRVPTDALGTLEAEATIINGTGSQVNLDRWGDYTSMSVDPADDCTFWYTNEYLQADGTFNWSTRIASFKFPSCK